MITYLARRFLQAVLVMLIVSVIVFVILHALPGGLVRAQLGPRASAYSVAQLERAEGLLKPLPQQFGIWLLHLLKGNFGYSYKLNQPVGGLLAHYLPRTLLLVGISSALTVAIGVPMGLWQGYRRNKPDDHALSACMLILYAMPDFLLGVVLIILLGLDLPVLPSTASAFGTSMPADIEVLVLPIAALTLGNVSYYSKYMRSSVIDNLLEDYVRTARAKGNPHRRVLVNHVLRNSLSSTITNLGLTLPYVFSGALIIEELFNFPGIGLLFWDASQSRDYPVLLGVVLVVTASVVVGSLLADIGYAIIDPRVRYA